MTGCEHVWSSRPVDDHIFCVKCDECQDEPEVKRRDAIYSGPGKSGICICGCSWEDHHLGMVMRLGCVLTAQGVKEHYIPQECDAFGCNETGGMKFNHEIEEWEDHCFGYRDRGI